jgi:hypothetical protein
MLNDTAMTPYHAREAPANLAPLRGGQFGRWLSARPCLAAFGRLRVWQRMKTSDKA